MKSIIIIFFIFSIGLIHGQDNNLKSDLVFNAQFESIVKLEEGKNKLHIEESKEILKDAPIINITSVDESLKFKLKFIGTNDEGNLTFNVKIAGLYKIQIIPFDKGIKYDFEGSVELVK